MRNRYSKQLCVKSTIALELEKQSATRISQGSAFTKTDLSEQSGHRSHQDDTKDSSEIMRHGKGSNIVYL